MSINYEKHIWEGWTVRDFIEALEVLSGIKILRTNKN